MPNLEVDVSLMKRTDSGQVVGFGVVAQPETYAEIFCSTLPKMLVSGEAEFKIDGAALVITHPRFGEVRRTLSAADAAELGDVLKNPDTKFGIYRAPSAFMTPGFMLVPEACKDIVKEFKLSGQ